MDRYDIVIIGSGLGGLECGYMLAREGMKVCILEKNRQFGGNLQIFVRDRAIFDTGIHYIGGLDPGQNLHRSFSYFGIMDKLKLKRMDVDGFDRVSFSGDGKEYRHAQGYGHFIETLSADFPKEREAIVQYCKKMKEITAHFPLYHLEFDENHTLDPGQLQINARGCINSITKNEKLQAVLAGTNMLYAGDENTPFYVHALIENSYIESAWKCVNGGSQIAMLLVKAIKNMGGTVLHYTTVAKLHCENEKVEYAELENGERIYGKTFISNIHPSETLGMLENSRLRPAYRHRIMNMQNTLSSFFLHLVLKKNSFPQINYNIYNLNTFDAWSGTDYKEEEWPDRYAVFSPPNAKTEEYADSISVMTYMRFDEVKKWNQTINTIPKQQHDRGGEYNEFKERKAEKILTSIEKKFPGIRDKIQSHFTSTPITFRDYLGGSDGTLYGVVKDSHEPYRSFISPKTKIENLLLTGQNLNLHGVLGVTISAIKTCGELVGLKYLLGKVRNG